MFSKLTEPTMKYNELTSKLHEKIQTTQEYSQAEKSELLPVLRQEFSSDRYTELDTNYRKYFEENRNHTAIQPSDDLFEAIGIKHSDFWRLLKREMKSELMQIKKLYEGNNDELAYCPICGLRFDDELSSRKLSVDHFLPKHKFNQLIFFPLNLVPMCSECNEKKANKVDYPFIFHPYFDSQEEVKVEVKLGRKEKFLLIPEVSEDTDERIKQNYNDIYNLKKIYSEAIFLPIIQSLRTPESKKIKNNKIVFVRLIERKLKRIEVISQREALEKLYYQAILDNIDEFIAFL